MISRRDFIKWSAAAGTWMYVSGATGTSRFLEGAFGVPIDGGTLSPDSVLKYQTPLLIPPVMPRAGRVRVKDRAADYYEISVKPVPGGQQILPPEWPKTPVWGYGPVSAANPTALMIHNAPSLTIEAEVGRPVRIKWINDLKDPETGDYVPHLLPVDPTLHWANPPGGEMHSDTRPDFTGKTYVPLADYADPETQYTQYTGPVPTVPHVHGAVGVGDDSDGYAEAWYLPDADNIDQSYATVGNWYEFFKAKAAASYGVEWGPGFAVFQYPNRNRASTVWYHDHALGMTRLNVYAGPAGFYIIRGGKAGDHAIRDARKKRRARLPGPAPEAGDAFPPKKTYYEIPIAIQDRAFNTDGTLFYPDSRAFFDGATAAVPGYIPGTDLSPMWNPEFFGNMIMVNGNTWPFLNVEQRRYRFRFLNGCQSRFLILDFNNIPGIEVWQIGNEGGLLPAAVNLTDAGNTLLMGLAERADLIVDFTNVPEGNHVLGNLGPDEPFGGGVPDADFDVSDPGSTGQIMQFRVGPAKSVDHTTPGADIDLPPIDPLPTPTYTRPLALLEEMSMYGWDGPAEALLGFVDGDGNPVKRMWMQPVTENPGVGDVEQWELYNLTADAHPMHVHEVTFEVVSRQALLLTDPDPITGEQVPVVPLQLSGDPRGPEPWETGLKDTVIAHPSEVTRIRAKFDTPGQFVWHCHIVEHEDNEMMRPYRIGPAQPGEPEPNVPAGSHPM